MVFVYIEWGLGQEGEEEEEEEEEETCWDTNMPRSARLTDRMM